MRDNNLNPMIGILIVTFMIIALAGAALALPPPPHRVGGDVTYEDGSPAVGVSVRFVNDSGVAVASDITDEKGYYDTELPPGLENDIPEPEDKTLDIYVGNWKSDNVLHWETGGSDKIDISGVPVPAVASVSTDSVTNVTVNSATLNATISFGDYGPVDAVFYYKVSGAIEWENTGLEVVSTEGAYSKNVTGLESDTTYEFKAAIRFDSLEDTGVTKSFTTATITPPEKDFSISVSPTSGSVVRGESATATVSLTSIAGFSNIVNLSASGLPSGATESFSPSSGTPSFTSTLTISTASTTPTGTYSITIKGTSGGKTRSCTYTLTVTAVPVPDFSIGISPASGSVVQGKSTTATVSVSSIAEFDETVDLSASGLPSGTTASFSIPSGTPSFDSILTISTVSTTPVGAYTVTIKGTDGGKTHSCTYSLTVTTVPVNQSPTADANGPYSVDEEKTVKLDGTGSSDPDGDTLTYSWTITSDPTGESSLTNSSTATPTFHAPSVDSDTSVMVKLTVDDGHGHTDSDTATVTVKAVALPPDEFLWPIILAIIIIVIVIVVICYWKSEQISRRLRKV